MADDTELETLLSLPPRAKDLSRSSEVLLGHGSKSASNVTTTVSSSSGGGVKVHTVQHHPRSGTLLTSHKFSFPTSPSRTPLFSDASSPPVDPAPIHRQMPSPHRLKNNHNEDPSTSHQVPRINTTQRKVSSPVVCEMSVTVAGELNETPPRWKPTAASSSLAARKQSSSQVAPIRDCFVSPPPTSQAASPSSHPLSLQHAFLTDVNDVKTMERNLLKLLDDFHSGKLLAFGQNDNISRMETIRKQQEQLARLHFDVGAELSNDAKDSAAAGLLSQQRLEKSKQNMQKFTDSLKQLSISIEGLNSKKEAEESAKSDAT
ncbi:unnamed protein product [Notodromas monacha]|uniref:Coiled-coil domain containing 28B n=2 Tax=Notodromas monacha TaxID=399045 RepID=A0A7R9GD62_9CRUS|nr:unnamed protein product [Notodromas monacha]CAG0916832.1 unnamed protein product [Notodromas monacha]